MRHIYYFIGIVLFLSSCQATRQAASAPHLWVNIAVADGVEIYADTAGIRHEGAVAYAYEKRVYTTYERRKAYVDRIKDEYAKMGKPEKAGKWNDFSYCIYYSLYDCPDRRFRVLSVEDYDSAGKLIARTTSSKKNARWLSVNAETVGDYTFFFVCDYGK
jgi:hypothetical protein